MIINNHPGILLLFKLTTSMVNNHSDVNDIYLPDVAQDV